MEQDTATALPCSDKLAFDSKTAAQTSATVAEWQHGNPLKVYKCRHCDLWHLASDTKNSQ